MGFDMYLNKKIDVDAEYGVLTGTISLKVGDKPVNVRLDRLKFIVERQAQWYNAYSIHKWFVDNVQNGCDNDGYYEVCGCDLQKLVDNCKQILENKELAKTLLPAADSYGFACDVYDDRYFKQVEDTVKQLNDLEEHAWYEYSSGW